jgi:ATP-dependent DNA ligase
VRGVENHEGGSLARATRAPIAGERARIRYRAQPGWIPPMLATPAGAAPRTDRWLYEPRLAGVRALAYAAAGRVQLFSRDRDPLDAGYPVLVEALRLAIRGDAVLDGVIVTADEFCVFDCLSYEGVDLTRMALVDRKAMLRDVVWYRGPIRLTPCHEAVATGTDRSIAKRAESGYESGWSNDWLAIESLHRRPFVIGGYCESRDSRGRSGGQVGALLVGSHERGGLRYAGRVRVRGDGDALDRLRRSLAPLHRHESPFAPGPGPADGVRWVAPCLVAEIGFAEWTPAGLLRHSRYLGLRAGEVLPCS